MKKHLAVLAAVAALTASPARSQEPDRRLELSPMVGAFVPILDQRDVFSDALLLGLRGTYDFHPNVALVATVSWARPESGGEGVDLFQWDVGVQGQAPLALSGTWTLKPFVGVGIGTRTYAYVDLDLDAQTDFAFYSALGADLRTGRFGLGLTARHQLTAFSPVGDSDARGDLALFATASMRL